MPVSSRGPAWPTGMQYPGMHGPGEPCLCPWEETIKKERISPGLTLYHVLSIPVSEVIGSCALSEARWILKFPLTGSRGRITGAGNVEKNSGEWENTLCALPASLKTWKKSEVVAISFFTVFLSHSPSLPGCKGEAFVFSSTRYLSIRNAPAGTSISKRAPCPTSPVSRIVNPKSERISRARERPEAGAPPSPA